MHPTDLEETIFHEALQLRDPAQRAAHLDQACAGHPELRQRMERLLQAADRARPFFEKPAAGPPPDQLNGQVTSIVPITEKPGDRIGRYKLLQQIGEGGCGVVYMAEQEEPVRRRVALKVIKVGLDTNAVIARFEAERQALALMDHPNIAKVLDAGATETGRPFFVMELVRGIKITDYCDQNNLSTRERLDLFIKVCQAIQHAHQKGVIHRDIKPSNILVTLQDPDSAGVPKVIDFGIAKATTDQRLTDKTLYTAFEQFIGTPAYMSPEQAELSGLDIDTRSDIYSLGVLLYELLIGKTPFDAQTLVAAGLDEMRRTIREKEPVRPSTKLNQILVAANVSSLKSPPTGKPTTEEEVRADSRRLLRIRETIRLVRGDLDWIVMKCLEKDRTRRYETANGLAMDIQRHLSNEPVVARPPTTAYRVRKFVRRNKMMVIAAGAVALVLVLGVLVSTFLAVRATHARREADTQRDKARQAEKNEAAERHKTAVARDQAQEAQRQAVQNLSVAEAHALQSRHLLYDADMNLAQQALKANNLGLARRLLDRHRPTSSTDSSNLTQPGKGRIQDAQTSSRELSRSATNDVRDWEWRYLWRQCQSDAESRLCKLDAGIISLSFAPDGDRLVATTLGQRAELWSRLNRQRLLTLTTNGTGSAQSWQAAFSPSAPLLAFGTTGGVILVSNLATGLHWKLETGALFADRLSFSADGSRLAALLQYESSKGRVVVWETEGFASLSTNEWNGVVDASYGGGAIRWSLGSDRLWILSGDGVMAELSGDSGSVVRLSVAEMKETGSGGALAVSPSGDRLAAGRSHIISVWDARTGHLLKSLDAHSAYVGALAFSPDGRWLASASADQTVRLWDTTDWHSKVLRGHSDEVHALAFTPDGTRLASGSRDGEVLLWRTDSHRLFGEREPLPAGVVEAVVALGSRNLLARMTNQAVVLIDTKTLMISPLPFAARSSLIWPSGLAVLADGANRLKFIEAVESGYRVMGDMQGKIDHGYAYSPKKYIFSFGSGTNSLTCVSLDPFGLRFELSGGQGVLEVHGITGGGRVLFGIDELRNILLWDLEDRRLLHRLSDLGEVELVVTPDLRDIVIYSYREREVQFRDFANPEKVLARVVTPYTVWLTQRFSPDHQSLAVNVNDTGSILLFDVKSRRVQQTFQRHLMAVHSMAFSPNGRRLGSGGNLADSVKLWDVETGQEILNLASGTFMNWNVHFSDDGNLILAGNAGEAGSWNLWSAPSWAEINARPKGYEW